MNKLALGVFYQDTSKPTFSEASGVYDADDRPLFRRELDKDQLKDVIASLK